MSSGIPRGWINKGDGQEESPAQTTIPTGKILCQACHGLQFFSDQARAAQKMKRVLFPGGRVALNVSRELDYNPYIRALADALERYVGPEAAPRC
jgi:hypothetical protein